jgi:hypothetical protein
MNLLEEFESGDLIVGSMHDCENELWAIVEGRAIKLTGTGHIPRYSTDRVVSGLWSWQKIMTFNDFTDVITRIK